MITQTPTSTPDTVTVTADSDDIDLTAGDARTITGLVLPWGETGRTSAGPMVFERGSISVPSDISHVKLLAGHSPAGRPVGHATAWHVDDKGLRMTFQLGSHADADHALLMAREKTIDALSIEATISEATGRTVTRSLLRAVALVPQPAFASARVAEVHAEDTPPAEDTEDTTPTGDGSDTAETAEDAETTESAEDADADTDTDKEDTMTTLQPGTLPSTPAATVETHASLGQVLDYLTAHSRGEDYDLHAALTDITDAGMVSRTAPQWLGELWSGVTYQRRVIPLLTQAPLRSRKAVGYRWTTKPTVAKYSGNKSDIPSTGAAVEAVERDAQRWAGGNDLDRVFWDFKETEFLNAYWRAMAESYAYETDKEAGDFVVENARALDGTADHIIQAIARGSIAVDQAVHTPATFALINPADFAEILSLAEMDAPKYLGLAGPVADPSKWVTSEFVKQGTAVVGAKAAVTHFELAGSPLRVEAAHIAKGGRDAALFGYTALIVNRPEALVKVNFKTTAPAGTSV